MTAIIPAKVCLLHFIDTLGAGGAERQLVYLLENLDRERFEPHVLTTYDTFRHYEAKLQRLGIPLHSLHHGDLTLRNRAQAMMRYVRLIRALRPQIVHSWLHYPNLIARVARPVCPPHRLITAIRTEYTPRQRLTEGATAWLSDFRIVIERNMVNRTTAPTGKITFIPNAVALQHLHPHNNKKTTQPRFNILMIARIDPRKDHLTLLNALHILKGRFPPNYKVILVGDITDNETQYLIENTLSTFNLGTLVEQHQPTEDIDAYYNATDITVLPSKSEGVPNVILESFAAAKPIIVSEAANRAGLVQHGINGWVFPTGNSKALASCLEIAWQTTEQERERMGQNGRTIAEQYTIPRMVKQHALLYERALKRR